MLLFLLPAFPARGEDEIGIQISSAEPAADGKVVVTVSLSNCGGMDSIQFDIWYDKDAAALVDATAGDLLKEGTYAFNTSAAGTIRFAYASAEGLDRDSGTAVELLFNVLQDTGSAVMVTDVKASQFDEENGAGQYKAFVTVENGGVINAGAGSVPEAGITPWIPETPTPSPEPTPEPTEIIEAQETPEPDNGHARRANPIKWLTYLFGGLAVIAFAAAAVVLLNGRKNRD